MAIVYDSLPESWNCIAQRSGREQESKHYVHGYGGEHKEQEPKVKWEDKGRNLDYVMIVYIDIKFNS